MTGKEIILEYLKTHEQFSPHELALAGCRKLEVCVYRSIKAAGRCS